VVWSGILGENTGRYETALRTLFETSAGNSNCVFACNHFSIEELHS
jgi:hypothetical protein